MKAKLNAAWAAGAPSARREPTAAELATGFPCGPADQALFNELAYRQSMSEAELANLVAASGITPSESDMTQVQKAVRSQRLNFITAANVGGTANAIALTLSPVSASNAEIIGTPIRFTAKANSTGAVTAAVDGRAALPVINNATGQSVGADDIILGQIVEVRLNEAGTAFALTVAARQKFTLSGSFGPSGSLGGVGTTAWVVPAGVTRVRVRLWSAGGAGGSTQAAPSAGAGAGGGGYAEGIYAVTPGQVISVTAGAAGVPGAAGTYSNGGNGGASSFGSYCSATGGIGGGGAATSGYSAANGAGGVPTGGNILNVAGRNGMPGLSAGASGVGMGGAGGHSYGGAGGAPSLGAGSAGQVPGGGGGGGANGGAGGSPGDGIVIVEW